MYKIEDIINKIHCADCLEFMKDIPDKSVDLVLTDPPYESLNRWKGIGTTARMGLGRKDSKSYNPSKFFGTISNEKLFGIMEEFYRILKKDTHCYVMCDNVTLPYFFNMMGMGFGCPLCIYRDDFTIKFNNLKPLIWDKENIGMGYHYRCRYEFILMFDKGKRRLKDLSIPDILKFKKYIGEVPTEKPIRLFELLIKQSSNEGDVILDPFIGSGTTAVACKELNRNYIGIDNKPEYCEIARKRINATTEPLFI